MKLRNVILRLVCAISFSAFAMNAFAQGKPVGRVLLAAGDTVAVRDGRTVRLEYNSPIEFKDTLRTGAASSLQVRFVDEGLLSLRENTEFQIEDYQFAGGQDAPSERSFFRLVKGGFRAVTGLIGRTRNANYRVQTQTATIGIRGTDYAARMCAGDCGANVKDGLYGTVLGLSSGTNQISVQNNATPEPQVFGINQHFYVPDANTAPQPLLQPPTFVSLRPQGKAQAAQQGGSGSGGERASTSSGVAAESRPQTVVETVTPQVTADTSTTQYTVTGEVTSGGTSALVPPAVTTTAVVPNTLGVLGGWIFPGDIDVQDEGGGAFLPTTGLMLDANGFPTAFKIPEGCIGPNVDCTGAPSGTLGAPIPGSAGSAFPNGSTQGIFWGRWDTGTMTDSGQSFSLSSTNQAHLMYGTLTPADVIAAKTGTLTLSSLTLGTHPTNNLGELANSGAFPTILVNFTNRTATVSSSFISFPSQSWSLPGGTGPITIVAGEGAYFLVQGSGPNIFSTGQFGCSGTGCGSTVYGKTGGIFLGPVGDHAGVSLSAGSGSAGFNTVRVYCPSGC